MKYCDVVATCKTCCTVCHSFSTVSKERDKLRFGVVHHLALRTSQNRKEYTTTTQGAVSNKSIEESIAAGQPLCIPHGAIHRFDNNETQDAKVLRVITPAALGPQYFRECA